MLLCYTQDQPYSLVTRSTRSNLVSIFGISYDNHIIEQAQLSFVSQGVKGAPNCRVALFMRAVGLVFFAFFLLLILVDDSIFIYGVKSEFTKTNLLSKLVNFYTDKALRFST